MGESERRVSPIICAIYARKSTDQADVADEGKSVTRQIESCRAYAERQDWTVASDHIYQDDGISGAEFARRPGLMALLNTLKPHPPFGALLIYDADRLGREQIETSYIMKQISQAEVRIFESKGGGRELALDSPIDKMVMSVLAGAAEIERAKARERTRDALHRKAERGYVCGGTLFGYRNINVQDESGRRSHVAREVVEIEAAAVRRIFELYAGGSGFKTIAVRLNDEGAPSPKPRRHPQRGWAPSSVRCVLINPAYRGALTWGRRRKRDSWGQARKQAVRPAAEWVVHHDEALRIVPEPL